MARIVLTDAKVTINAVDLSQYITSVGLTTSADVIETTGFNAGGARLRIAGLLDNQVTFEFNQDYAASAVEATINPIGASLIGTSVAVTVCPTQTPSVTSPKYSFNCIISEWQPLSGAVGELATASVSWPITGVITKTTI